MNADVPCSNDSKTNGRSLRHSGAGQVLVLLALALPLLLTILGLALDGGRLYFERRHAQIAADAGARSAALELFRGNTAQADVDEASGTDAFLNGYDRDAADTDVVAVIGPTGYNTNFVSVTVTDTVPTTLLRIFSRNHSTVAARAVAGIVPDSAPPCVLALNEEVPGALTISGTGFLNAPGCKVMSNSDSPSSITANGGGCITAEAIGFVGPGNAITNGGNCLNPYPAGQAIPEADPYAYLTAPDPADYVLQSNTMVVVNEGNVSSLSPLQPGYYNLGIKPASTVTINLDLAPGVYLVNGFHASGNVVLRGTGVTIIDLGGPGPLQGIDIAGTVDVQLSAPTSGDWKNILFYSLSTTDSKLTGNANSTFEGTMYFPNAELRFGRNQTSETFGMVIADTITIDGNPLLSVDYDGAGRTEDLTTIALVE